MMWGVSVLSIFDFGSVWGISEFDWWIKNRFCLVTNHQLSLAILPNIFVEI